MAVDFPEVLLEDPPRLGRRRGEPAPDERRLIADIGHVPEPAAEQLNRLRVDLRLFDLAGDLFESRTTYGQQQGVERWRGRCGGIAGGVASPRHQAPDRRCGVIGAW